MNLNFHESFFPDREALSQLLRFAQEAHTPHSKEQLSAATGIPTGKSSGKVVPHLKYASYMGLLDFELQKGQYKLRLTPSGKLVHQRDPFFMQKRSLVLCQTRLAGKFSHAVLWSTVFNEVIPLLGQNIQSVSVQNVMESKFHRPKVNLSPLKSCYTSSNSMGGLSLLKVLGNNFQFCTQDPDKSLKYIYALDLMSIWEHHFKDETEVDFDSIVNDFGWGNPLVWSNTTKLAALEMISDTGLIRLNRQLNPVSVVKTSSVAEILRELEKDWGAQ